MKIRRKDQLVAACLYSTCRLFALPRSLDEVVKATGLSRRDVGRAYRRLCRVLSLRPLPLPPSSYFERVASALGMSEEERRRGLEILEGADSSVTSGRFPTSLAAAAYLACNGRVGKTKVSRAAGVSEVALRDVVKELAARLGIPTEVRRSMEVVEVPSSQSRPYPLPLSRQSGGSTNGGFLITLPP